MTTLYLFFLLLLFNLFFSRPHKRTIYFDLDGVLAVWNKNASLDEINDPTSKYFRRCRRQLNAGLAVFFLWISGYDVRFLSKAPNEQAGRDKRYWLKRWVILFFIPVVIVPYDESKNDYVTEEGNILVDDYHANLLEWKGIGVKFYNRVNGHGGTKYSYSISHKQPAIYMASYLARLADM